MKTGIYAEMVNPNCLSEKEIGYFEKGEKYPVTGIIMGQSRTSIYFDFGEHCFNSVAFEFYNEEGKLHDIYKDIRFNPYLALR